MFTVTTKTRIRSVDQNTQQIRNDWNVRERRPRLPAEAHPLVVDLVAQLVKHSVLRVRLARRLLVRNDPVAPQLRHLSKQVHTLAGFPPHRLARRTEVEEQPPPTARLRLRLLPHTHGQCPGVLGEGDARRMLLVLGTVRVDVRLQEAFDLIAKGFVHGFEHLFVAVVVALPLAAATLGVVVARSGVLVIEVGRKREHEEHVHV
mmetsp:Transcript_71880/g.191868  ORF Transcript_71880/g.191868 Transcript_71880/m.191868 type:complete len:204 (-) Transcript_71880:1505-2116(-)